MKNLKSNIKIHITKKFSLRHPPYDLSTTFHYSSEQSFDFTMLYNRYHKSSGRIDWNKTFATYISSFIIVVSIIMLQHVQKKILNVNL